MSDIISKERKVDEKSEETLVGIIDDEPVVAGAKIMCSNQPNQFANMIIKTSSSDKRNGNLSLKDTDILFYPVTFKQCNSRKGFCVPQIESSRWKCCNEKDLIEGRPSVTMDSFMICTNGGGMITIVKNGQIAADSLLHEQSEINALPYAQELEAEEIEELVKYFFNKIGWLCQDDIDNTEYIAKCMKEAGMDTRMSIEFFLLSCCPESGKGAELKQIGGNGLGFIQLTGLKEDQWKELATQGNQWRKACGKTAISWKNTPPSIAEVRAAVVDRDALAWEGSIYYWCNIKITERNSTPLNDYVAGYEDGSKGESVPEGLYFAVECFVNGKETGEQTSKIRMGEIDKYIIEENPSTATYDYQFRAADGSSNIVWTAPNGAVERARVYMEYYDMEEPIWNFSEDILNNWNTISS